MKRETLVEILKSRSELVEKDGSFRVSEKAGPLELTVYLGKPGGALAVPRVVVIEARPAFVRIVTSKDDSFYGEYDQIRALLVGSRPETGRNKAGFG